MSILNPGGNFERRLHTANDARFTRVANVSDDETANLVVTSRGTTIDWDHRQTHDENKKKLPLTHRLHGLASHRSLHAHCHLMRAGNEVIPHTVAAPHGLASEHALAAHNRAIHEESMRIDPPEGLVCPMCHCNKPCAMVQAALGPEQTGYDEAVNILLWVCDPEECMFSAVQDVASAESAEDDASIPLANNYAIYAAEDSGTPPPEGEESESAEMFWAGLSDKMIPLNDGQVQLICPGNVAEFAPICDCGTTCSVAQCLLSSDIFWVCSGKGCKFVWLEQSLGKTQSFDTGKEHVLGDYTIDRYTTPGYLMRGCGYSLSRKFFFKLQEAQVGTKFPKGSYQIEPGEEYDSFISYRGATGSVTLWLALCGEFHWKPTAAILFILFPIVVILLRLLIFEPCQKVSLYFVGAGSCYYDEEKDEMYLNDVGNRRWFVFIPYGGALITIVLLFWNPLFSFGRKSNRIFLDKYCIHQSHLESTFAGLQRLPLYLKGTKKLLCLFDANYAKRLWCIFELAVYLKMRQAPKVVFASISKNNLEIFAVLSGLFLEVLFHVIFSINQHLPPHGHLTPFAQTLLLWFTFGYWTFMSVTTFLLAQRHFLDLFTLRDVVANYDVRRAELGMEVDRPILLDFIDSLFRKKSTDDSEPATPAPAMAITNTTANADEEEQAAAAPDAAAIQEQDANAAANFVQAEQAVGLRLFNEAVQKTVPQEIPVKGLKSWAVFGYIPAVLYGTAEVLLRYDIYAYASTTTIRWGSWSQAFTTIFSFGMRALILWPMRTFVLGAEIRFFLWLQRMSKLPYWWSVAVFLPLFLFVERVLSYRRLLFFNLDNLVTLACGSAVLIYNDLQSGNNSPGLNPTGQYEHESYGYFGVPKDTPTSQLKLALPLQFRPFYGIFELLAEYVGYCEIDHIFWDADTYRTNPNFDREAAERHSQVICRLPNLGGGGGDARFAPGWESGEKISLDGAELYTSNITYDFRFNWTWWGVVLVWFLIILPLIALLYYVYEPHGLKPMRRSAWAKISSCASWMSCWSSTKKKTKGIFRKKPKKEERSIFQRAPDTLGAHAELRMSPKGAVAQLDEAQLDEDVSILSLASD